ncbi:MAG: DUF3097 domain-containing protein [Acidimicrobiales bacterium]|jgi:hypothetical protein|nr:DUF3097 domain-containing protein [Acidimicrobiales bacterium]
MRAERPPRPTEDSPTVYRRGILTPPPDLDAPTRPRRAYPTVEATPGLWVTQRGSGIAGAVLRVANGVVTVRGEDGRDRQVRARDGGFDVGGRQVTLVPARARDDAAPRRTASGSIAVPDAPARMARASRIYVEGRHDAELIELVWGDDLRIEGVVVELLEGADHLEEVVRRFGPRPGRRLGILLDHLVPGSKEARLAATVDHPDVLITGHPYVDIWAAVKPSVVGIERWPEVAKGRPWKEGVCAALGVEDPGRFWTQLRNRIGSWTDLEPPLVGAVESLIDFVTQPQG